MERKHTGIDYTLLFLLFLLMCVSLVAIYSGAGQYFSDDPTYFVVRQLIWYGIGAVVIVAVMLVDFDLFRNFSIPVYAIGMVLLLAVEFFGEERNGAQRWVFGIQPSEFMKIFLILALAHLLYKLTKDKQKRTFKEDMVVLGKILLVSLPPFFLILKQPDLGTALVIGSVIATMLLMSGIRWRILLSLVGIAVLGIAFLVYMHEAHFEFFSEYLIEPHQLDRIYGWLDPDSDTSGIGYQLNQAILGIGSGQLFGAGFLEGMQTQSDVIPEIHTDFVFTVIGEEFGFLGAMVLLVIYFLLFYRMIMISLTCNNLYGSYLVAGVVGLLVFQVFQNIAMTIGLMPITGLALPFISYGGSALLTNMMAIGIVLNVHYRTKNYMFTSEDTFS
ncbi:rod shape-determining protein RodA [Shouchella clausii]|uniref:Cell division protein FtsW n=3 Tax=Shouchella TaxID=2893057 RepID=Q5WE77_SHOC1|nr:MULTISPECIES: rod shape-determining protein RodA [Shouchella]MCM3313739.1 rod shape-determining protein RodA [Psychrobacillus sp. MER TA 17]ALA54277.1 Cell division protein FtsW [Shouchella clausii]KKI86428.1 cell cycle protein [Shouchella clausii]MBU3232608.1 rod shape-determining protein RodA [Shouchella clausii]MBU3265986.1 rod shape-determining protein RodA [Shouchella clausii]